MGTFALRRFNTLSRDRGISGIQVAPTLLNLADEGNYMRIG